MAARAFVLVAAVAVAAVAAAGLTAAAPSCAGSSWGVAESNVGWSEATGQHTATFVVTNRDRATCTLHGYPGIVLVGARGRPLRFSYSHRGDQMITGDRPRAVRVRAGGHAAFAFNKYRCDVRATAVARFARVRLPGVDSWSSVRLAHYPIIDFCGERPSLTIAVSPIVARLEDAAARH